MASSGKKRTKGTNKKKTSGSSTRKKTSASASSKKKSTGRTSSSSQKKTQTSAVARTRQGLKPGTRVEVWDLVLLLLAVLFNICLFLYEKTGAAGQILNRWMIGLFGMSGYLFGIYLLVILILHMTHKQIPAVKWICAFAAILLWSVILYLANGDLSLAGFHVLFQTATVMNGGAWGGLAAVALSKMIGRIGAMFVCLALLVILLVVMTERSVLRLVERAGDKAASESDRLKQHHEENASYRRQQQEEEARRQEERRTAAESRHIRNSSQDLVITDSIPESEKTAPTEEEPLDIPFLENDYYTQKKRMTENRKSVQDTGKKTASGKQTPASRKSRKKEAIQETEELSAATMAADETEPVIHLPGQEDTFGPVPDLTDPDPVDPSQVDEDLPGGSAKDQTEPGTHTTRKKTQPADAQGQQRLPEAQGHHQTMEEKEATAAALSEEEPETYVFPPMDLLQRPSGTDYGEGVDELKEKARELEDALRSFGVEAKVLSVNRGPAVTRYELQPSEGVRVSRIMNLADDIALNLATSSIRIEQISGKKALGIEVPNRETTSVYLREVIDSDAFRKMKSPLAFALGKDIDGRVQVTDLAKMPHLLIAGSTGSGKSVCINSLLMSLIYKSSPDEVGLILIDPKVVELSVYNGIPHLLTPVVTDPNKAALSLNWAVQEMTRRYKVFSDQQVRDIRGYNEKVEMQPELELPVMKRIVIIIDELADLMMASSSNEVESHICRLAQMARAAGLHLVIATQRPSVDVITGLIKANIPSRLSFATSSAVDSRTILDMAGAEKLLGKGDMLFAPIGSSKPTRIQGAFVTDHEVERVVSFIRRDASVVGDQSLTQTLSSGSSGSDGTGEDDEYLADAIQLVVERQKASISMLQRAFPIGFNRAGRLMDVLEERGIVGPEQQTKPRKVLMTMDDLRAMNETNEK